MPVSKKKRTTSKCPFKVRTIFAPAAGEEAFQQHLRTLTQSAVRTGLELVMGEESDAFINTETWRQPPLQAHSRALPRWRAFSIRHGEKADATIILTADGAWIWKATKEVLTLHACAEESKEGWLSLLQDVRTRGATQNLIVTDGHDGLLAA